MLEKIKLANISVYSFFLLLMYPSKALFISVAVSDLQHFLPLLSVDYGIVPPLGERKTGVGWSGAELPSVGWGKFSVLPFGEMSILLNSRPLLGRRIGEVSPRRLFYCQGHRRIFLRSSDPSQANPLAFLEGKCSPPLPLVTAVSRSFSLSQQFTLNLQQFTKITS